MLNNIPLKQELYDPAMPDWLANHTRSLPFEFIRARQPFCLTFR